MRKKLIAVPVPNQEPVRIITKAIPGYVAINVAQCLTKDLLAAWENPAIRADFERYKLQLRKKVYNTKEDTA